MDTLCPDNIHLIAQLPTGRYACAECGAQFAEYHELHLTAGIGALLGVGHSGPVVPVREEADGGGLT